jgi:hypothetical protein
VNHSQHFAEISLSLSCLPRAKTRAPEENFFRYKEKEWTPPDRGNGFVTNYPSSSVQIVRHGRKLPVYEKKLLS